MVTWTEDNADDSQESTVPGNDQQLTEMIALTEEPGLQLQGAGLHFEFIRLEVMLKIADSAFEYELQMPCICGPEKCF